VRTLQAILAYEKIVGLVSRRNYSTLRNLGLQGMEGDGFGLGMRTERKKGVPPHPGSVMVERTAGDILESNIEKKRKKLTFLEIAPQ